MGAKRGDVGIIGLGRIGWPLAENLLEANWSVHGFRRHGLDEFAAIGGHPCGSAADVGAAAEVVITCLPDERALSDTVGALLTSSPAAHTVVEMSTFGLEFKRRQADRLATVGITMMDCPVLGLPPMVARRRGVVFASGPEQGYRAIASVLDGVTDVHRHVGAFGNGTTFKFVANTLVALNTVAAAEALALATAADLDVSLVLELLDDGAAASTMLRVKGPMMAKRTYEPSPGPVRVLAKDVVAIGEFARELGVRLPALQHAADLLETADRSGRTDHDTACLFELVDVQPPAKGEP